MALRFQSGDRRQVAPRRVALQLQRPLLGQLHVGHGLCIGDERLDNGKLTRSCPSSNSTISLGSPPISVTTSPTAYNPP